jgi:hypothetical protein
MSYTERIFSAARKPFGKGVYKAWPRIVAEAEHALWVVWNPKYGPLNAAQREYALGLIVYALGKAEGHPNPYGAYYYHLRKCLNHETVDAGFKQRGDDGEMQGEVADLLDSLYEGVAA